MKNRWISPLATLIAWLPALAVPSQPVDLILQGHVFHLQENGTAVPEKGLPVTHVGYNRAAVTNDDGNFWLAIPSSFAPGEEIQLYVAKEGWRVSLAGLTRIPADPSKEWIRIEMLPLGAESWLSPEHIEDFIASALRASATQIQLEAEQPTFDFSRSIREWAVKYRLSPEVAKIEIDKWIVEVKEASNNERRLGLAAFAERQFEKAAIHFSFAAAASNQELERIEKEQEDLAYRKKGIQATVAEDYRKSAIAFQRARLFESAVVCFQKALRHVNKEEEFQAWTALQLNLEWALDKSSGVELPPAVSAPFRNAKPEYLFQAPLKDVLAPAGSPVCAVLP